MFFGERAMGAKIASFRSFRCECGVAWEEDGRELLSGEERELELRENGRWLLAVNPLHQVQAAAVLRKVIGGTPAQALSRVKEGLSGTSAEMQRIQFIFDHEATIESHLTRQG
jgi:hypothetical protein